MCFSSTEGQRTNVVMILSSVFWGGGPESCLPSRPRWRGLRVTAAVGPQTSGQPGLRRNVFSSHGSFIHKTASLSNPPACSTHEP